MKVRKRSFVTVVFCVLVLQLVVCQLEEVDDEVLQMLDSDKSSLESTWTVQGSVLAVSGLLADQALFHYPTATGKEKSELEAILQKCLSRIQKLKPHIVTTLTLSRTRQVNVSFALSKHFDIARIEFTPGLIVPMLLSIGLVVAAGVYVVSAIHSSASLFWITAEIIGLCIFGFMGIAGIKGSAWWLVCGWGLHSVWDIGTSYFDLAETIIPFWYIITCSSVDLLVSIYIVSLILKPTSNVFQPMRARFFSVKDQSK